MNIDPLLLPLDAASPCGTDLSFSPEFDAVVQMLRFDDPSLSQGEWVTELKTADWPGAAAACEDLLRTKTKDLRVAGWLLEAWSHLHGYAGLADGIALAHGLCERFWLEVHPQPEGRDFDLRIGALSRLLAQTASLANALPAVGRGATAHALRDIDAARALHAASMKSQDHSPPPAGKLTMDLVHKTLRETPPSLLAERRDAGIRARAALQALQAVVDGHLGDEGPAFTAAKTALDDAVHALERLARDGGAVPAAAPPPSQPQSEPAAPPSMHAASVLQPNTMPPTRAEALAQLRRIAEFFRSTEPHSPVAYLAERAAHWGEMPLHEWLRLVMKDGATLAQLEELLGVEPKRAAE